MAVDYGVLAQQDGLLPGIGQAIAKIIAARERRKDRRERDRIRIEDRNHDDIRRQESRQWQMEDQRRAMENAINQRKSELGISVGDPTYDDIANVTKSRYDQKAEADKSEAELRAENIRSAIADRNADNFRQTVGQWGTGIKNVGDFMVDVIKLGSYAAKPAITRDDALGRALAIAKAEAGDYGTIDPKRIELITTAIMSGGPLPEAVKRFVPTQDAITAAEAALDKYKNGVDKWDLWGLGTPDIPAGDPRSLADVDPRVLQYVARQKGIQLPEMGQAPTTAPAPMPPAEAPPVPAQPAPQVPASSGLPAQRNIGIMKGRMGGTGIPPQDMGAEDPRTNPGTILPTANHQTMPRVDPAMSQAASRFRGLLSQEDMAALSSLDPAMLEQFLSAKNPAVAIANLRKMARQSTAQPPIAGQ